jgi:hypothetical protein
MNFARCFSLAPLVLMVALTACASGPRSATAARTHALPDLQSLDETRALALIDELLLEAEQEPHNGPWKVELAPRAGLDVDVRLGESGYGIEWVSDEDRLAYGDRLPAPDPDGQLRLLRADDGHGQPALILVLDHETYRFASDARAARELGDERDVKQRLRRDLQDFIDYTKSQIAL